MNKYLVKAEKYGYVSEDYISVNICFTDTLDEANEISRNLNSYANSFEELCRKYLELFNLKRIQDEEDLLSFLKKEGDNSKIKYYELLLCFSHDISWVESGLFSSMTFPVEEVKYVTKA